MFSYGLRPWRPDDVEDYEQIAEQVKQANKAEAEAVAQEQAPAEDDSAKASDDGKRG